MGNKTIEGSIECYGVVDSDFERARQALLDEYDHRKACRDLADDLVHYAGSLKSLITYYHMYPVIANRLREVRDEVLTKAEELKNE